MSVSRENMILESLIAEQDIKYGDFSSKLIPGVPREKVIGVRAPALKKIAKSFYFTCFNIIYCSTY